jgi:oligopeptidase B
MTTAPNCKKIPHELEIHNDKRIDNYYWLNNRENQEVIDYLNKENEYTNNYFKSDEDLQTEIYNEIVGRIDPKESSVPFFLDGYFYYQKYEEGVQYPFYCRKLGDLIAEEEIYLNVNDLAIGKSYCGMGKVEFNTQNSILAYSVDFVSRRLYTIYFKNNNTGEILTDEIPNTSGGFAWANDGKTIFYTLKDEKTLRSFKIMKHVLGTPLTEDKMVYIEEDDTFTTSVYTSKSKEFIMIGSQSTVSTEYRYVNANHPDEEFKLFCPRRRNHEYSVYHYKNHFYILSNWNAQNFKLCTTEISNTNEENWKEILPHDKDTLIEGLDIFNGFLVVDERNNGLTRFRVINLTNASQYFIDLEEPSYMAQSGSNPNFDSETFRYVFTSLKTPSTVIDFNLNNHQKEIKKQQKVIGGYDSNEYVTDRLWATAEDGTQIPISIISHKNTLKNGENPTLLYAYGSYGISSDATFSIARLSLLQRGFIFAIAHIRGGEDMGRNWYEDGKLLKKMNTFTDFISCGKYLVAQKFTSPKYLCALGGSAGGMLMGGIINMEPHLWKAVIAAVPFVDVLTTMLDDTIPLTTGEYDEWGNPNDPEYYFYMKKYSPYDNVQNLNYPALLVTTGLHDSQVQYWEPAKWVAKLREYNKGDSPILLKTNMEVGHGGASGRYEYYKEVALEYAFLIKNVK